MSTKKFVLDLISKMTYPELKELVDKNPEQWVFDKAKSELKSRFGEDVKR